jgi:Beta-lactamase enzyme family
MAWASGLAVALLLGGLAVDVAAHRRSHAKSGTERSVSGRVARTGASAGKSASRVKKVVDPFKTPAWRAALRTRDGKFSAAVDDLRTHQTWLYHPSVRAQTASIVKADILETLLHQAEIANQPLNDNESDLVQGMIENSNDNDATDLWNLVGGSSAVAAYNREAGLTQTAPHADGFWGETTTSAADQIRLLRQLILPHGLLNRASQDYQLGLMENVESDQAWGVSGGVPSGVDIALKNGWVPLTSATNWEVNSIGRVKGHGQKYLIAVLTVHDPSEAYGIQTIDRLSKVVWEDLTDARSARS